MDAPLQSEVSGTISGTTMPHCGKLFVCAYAQGLRHRKRLGEYHTDASGRYVIRYPAASCRDGVGTALLVVAFEPDPGYKPAVPGTSVAVPNDDGPPPGYVEIGRSPPRRDVPPMITIDITVVPLLSRKTEFERLSIMLPPLLQNQGVALDGLLQNNDHQDIDYLAATTGEATDAIEDYVLADRMAHRTNVEAAFHYAVLREQALVGLDPARPASLGLTVTLSTPTDELVYDLALLPPETIRAALEHAVQRQLVPRFNADMVARDLARLALLRPEAEAYHAKEGPARLLQIISTFVDPARATAVRDALENVTLDDPASVMSALQAVMGAGPPAAQGATTLAVAQVVGFDPAAVARVQTDLDFKAPDDLRRLVRSPAAKASADPATQAAVERLRAGLEARFPSAAFAGHLERDTAPPVAAAPVVSFFDAHPEFDLLNTNIAAFLRDKAIKPAVVSETVANDLRALQRTARMANGYNQAAGMLRLGLGSARAIVSQGVHRFTQAVTGASVMSATEAADTFARARDIHDGTMLLAGDMRALGEEVRTPVQALMDAPAAAKALQRLQADFPNLQTLFGGADVCSCSECHSVWGAAAYLVDILSFLRKRMVVKADGTPGDAWAALTARRPDLLDIDLGCDNTDTEFPYIDLVCELLGELVAPSQGVLIAGPVIEGLLAAPLRAQLAAAGIATRPTAFITTEKGRVGARFRVLRDPDGVYTLRTEAGQVRVRQTRQTLRTSAELMARPEYSNPAAAAALKAAVYAFSLPFDSDLAEARSALNQLGVSRADLMRQLGAPAADLAARQAAEQLGLSQPERDLIIGASAPDPAIVWKTTPANPVTVLAKVDRFLTASGLSFAELSDLLGSLFVDPGEIIKVTRPTPDPSNPASFAQCDTSQMTLAGLDSAALDRMHRFLRLRRRLRWTIPEIDLAVMAPRLGGGKIDLAALGVLADLVRLQARFSRPVTDVVALFGVLAADGPASPHARLFQRAPANPMLSVLALQANVALPAGDPNRKSLTDARDTIASALGLPSATVDALVAAAAPRLGADGPVLGLRGLAEVAAPVLLGRMLGITPAAVLSLATRLGVDPFASPAATMAFAGSVGRLTGFGLTVNELDHILAQAAPDSPQRALSDAASAALLAGAAARSAGALHDAIAPLAAAGTPQAEDALVHALLHDGLSASATILTGVDALLAGQATAAGKPAAQFVAEALSPLLAGPAIDPSLVTAAIEPARTAVIGAPPATQAAMQTALRGAILAARPYAAARLDAARATLAQTMGIAADIADTVLAAAVLGNPVAAGRPRLLALLTDPALLVPGASGPVPADTTTAAFVNHRGALALARALSDIATDLRLTAAELLFLLTRSAPLGWVSPYSYPYAAGQPPVPLPALLRVLDALVLARGRPAAADPADSTRAIDFWAVLTLAADPAATLPAVLGAFATWTGHDLALLTALDARFGLSSGGMGVYRTALPYTRLDEAATTLRRTRLTLAAADALIIPPGPTPAAVEGAFQAAKAAYDDTQWLTILKQIEDPIRTQRRDALVAYLLAANPDLQVPDDLSSLVLMDVEMGVCRGISRISGAHQSVQTFVTGCLMGLEPDAKADVTLDPDWNQWTWMQEYRVTQAAIKIFTHPASYIQPDLRDDDSEPFAQAQNTLGQNEITRATVETVAENYLAALDEISFLEVMACFYVINQRTMHVVARTRGGDPAIYYHRTYVREQRWTPWRKVGLDISSDHLILFTRSDRLFMAWLIMSEAANNDDSATYPGAAPPAGTPAPTPNKHWLIQIAVSEYDGATWLTPRLSRDGLVTQDYRRLPSKAGFRLSALAFATPGNLFGGTPMDFVKRLSSPDTQVVSVAYLDDGIYPGNTVQNTGFSHALGVFSLIGCKGYPEPVSGSGATSNFMTLPFFVDTKLLNMRFTEQGVDATNDLSVFSALSWGVESTILANTPDDILKPSTRFRVAYPFQTSLIDILIFMATLARLGGVNSEAALRYAPLPLGTMMPFFFDDARHAYAVTPEFYPPRRAEGDTRRKTFTNVMDLLEGLLERYAYYMAEIIAAAGDATKLAAIAKEIQADPKLAALAAEMASYQGLIPGNRFDNFYDPLACHFRMQFIAGGMPLLLSRDTQAKVTDFNFQTDYSPTILVDPAHPVENVDFSPGGAYSSYHWELFFQLPYLVSVMLKRRGQFSDAWDWVQRVFDPIGAHTGPIPGRYWVTKPFSDLVPADYDRQRIEAILYGLAAAPLDPATQGTRDAIDAWRRAPFSPHAIARTRITAYQKAFVLHAVDTLRQWGDQYFTTYTAESITRAEQLYMLAARILGPRSRVIPPPGEATVASFNELEPDLDSFGNAMVELENYVTPASGGSGGGGSPPVTGPSMRLPYFCIPPDENMLAAWNVIDDRLIKIRSCRNIDGIAVPLPLFAPPIDPNALVRAAAAGLDIGSIIAGFGAPLPVYRFQTLIQRASELAQEARAVAGSLLAVLEKRDAERLALLRSSHEVALQDAILTVRRMQYDEAVQQITVLQRQTETAQARQTYYFGREFMNDGEKQAVSLGNDAIDLTTAALVLHVASAVVSLLPTLQIGIAGFGGSPAVQVSWGSTNVTGALGAAAAALSAGASIKQTASGLTATLAGYARRMDEWQFQGGLATKEIAALGAQSAAAGIRRDIANQEIENQKLQKTNTGALDAFMRGKFTNDRLYDWMISRIAGPTQTVFNLARDMAVKAQRAMNHELGTDQVFIGASQWDSTRMGLTAGDLLVADIRRMEAAYTDQNKREYEITKYFSLAEIDPEALEELKQTGACYFSLPEALYDLDYSGHYMRRFQSVSLTLPVVAGPSATVPVRLTLVADSYRTTTRLLPGATDLDRYAEAAGGDDRFVTGTGGIQSIVTSQAQNETGVSERSQTDGRYMPFEGAGGHATFRVEILSPMPSFDRLTITDAMLIARLSAREGGDSFRAVASSALVGMLEAMLLANSARQGLWHVIDLRREDPFEWDRFVTTGAANLRLRADHFPRFTSGRTITPKASRVIARGRVGGAALTLTLNGAAVPLAVTGAAAPPAYSASGPVLPMETAVPFATTMRADYSELLVFVRYEIA